MAWATVAHPQQVDQLLDVRPEAALDGHVVLLAEVAQHLEHELVLGREGAADHLVEALALAQRLRLTPKP
jgi:hypothetical protein